MNVVLLSGIEEFLERVDEFAARRAALDIRVAAACLRLDGSSINGKHLILLTFFRTVAGRDDDRVDRLPIARTLQKRRNARSPV